MKSITDAGFANREILLSGGQVHVIGAGPVGLLLTALLQSMEDFPFAYMRSGPNTRVPGWSSLPHTLSADSLESYCADYVDGDNVEAVFEFPSSKKALHSGSLFLWT